MGSRLIFVGIALSAALCGLGGCDRAPSPDRLPGSAALVPAVRLNMNRTEQPRLTGADGDVHKIQSLLNIPAAMNYGDSVWNEAGVPAGDSWLLVDLEGQTISYFQAGQEVGTAVTLFGVDGMPTPTGKFKILNKLKDHRSSTYDAEMPYTLRLTNDGISIHASDVMEGVGTHGCVGIPLDFAKRLFDRVKVGDDVIIVKNTRDILGSSPHASKALAVG